MKKILSFIIAAVVLAAAVCTCVSLESSAAGLLMPDDLGGINNVMLTYTFAKSGAVSGRHTVTDLSPYVGYYDTDGVLRDTFFDSFLFLPCVTTGPSGGAMYKSSSNPGIASDWEAYLDDLFRDGYNLDALNTAVGNIAAELGLDGYKADIFFTVLYPVQGQTGFGTIGGVTYDFSKEADRLAVCRWQIDNYIERFTAGGYENLNLYGFYWFEEYIETSSPAEKALLTGYNSYVAEKGYSSIWIPYYNAEGWNRWKEYGFTAACLQPNYMFNSKAESTRIQTAVSKAAQYGMCNEVEASGSVVSSAEYYNRYLTYLRDGAEYGAMNAVKMYYQEVFFYYNCYKSDIPEVRLIYDLTYKYAKATLTEDDINDCFIDVFDPTSEYDTVSLGCSYTATAAYTGSGTLDYQDISGTELTDGVYGGVSLGTEWHSFYRKYTENDGSYRITVDLGAVYNDLRCLYMEFGNDHISGIAAPSAVSFYVSSDGKEYTLLSVNDVASDVIGYPVCKYVSENGFSARYVRAVFSQPTGYSFVFVSELAVCADPVTDIDFFGGRDIVSIGCSYTASLPFTDTAMGGDLDYKNISGTELTDGVLGSSVIGTEWHDMYAPYLEEGERFFAIIDLGKQYGNLGYFALQFGREHSYGISNPSSVTFSVSEDGAEYTEVCTVPVRICTGDGYGYAFAAPGYKVSGRFVKAEFDSGAYVHNFVSEFAVGVTNEVSYGAGDVNMSGMVDAADYLMIKRIFLGTYPANDLQYMLADVNGDGAVTAIDYIMVKRHCLGTFTIG